ncbi:MAG: hypothetical protein RBR59_06540 [Sulfurimonadaceae bacterium]|jgi:hypothetical protein|nr:hypothetical protein [Sulfurimonadaceae bacterium]
MKICYIKNILVIGIGIILLNGCGSGQPNLKKIKEDVVDKYEQNNMAKYEEHRKQYIHLKPIQKWIQPNNKVEKCLVYFEMDSHMDKTIKSDYSLFWDGDCKNGLANGIGRTIENTLYNTIEEIAFFDNGKIMDYCVRIDKLENSTLEGECGYGYGRRFHFVSTIIDEKSNDIKIEYRVASGGKYVVPTINTTINPFEDLVMSNVNYLTHSFFIMDVSAEKLHVTHAYGMGNEKGLNGYIITLYSDGDITAYEAVDNKRIANVILPKNYVKKRLELADIIENNSKLALESQKKAIFIKDKYKNKICKNNVTVDFMDNNEYKSICYENEKLILLQTKIDNKLARINQNKQSERYYKNQERLIKAREQEAIAAQRNVAAAEEANNQRDWNNLNQSMHNINQNNQLQQLNNNIMLNSLIR